ncbi:MAG: hypothetical protein P1T08_16785 [Acidimicrobiia bacterium]|nr:hypothetical protein [Acidimicrobiia bacterium]
MRPTSREPCVKNGTYGTGNDKRQMFRCIPTDGPVHKFAGVIPRLVNESHSCDHCENTVASHEGPRVAHRYEFPVAQAAAALVMIGQGVSYTETADRMRARNFRDRFDGGAQLVCNWAEILGPVVVSEYTETEWPETVVLDATWFMVTNKRTGDTTRAFSVLGAHGYPEGHKRGRCWMLRATPTRTARDWENVLRSLPGEPKMVICDEDAAIIAAVSKVWPDAFIKRCEHHLRESVIKKMAPYGLTAYGSPEMELLNDGFHSSKSWRAFKKKVSGAGVEDWIVRREEVIGEQVRLRGRLPQHHSTGALDEDLARVREFMEPRAFCYRNAERTNRLLELVRLRLSRCDDPLIYARAIRKHLDSNGGKLGKQGTIRDKAGHPSLRA